MNLIPVILLVLLLHSSVITKGQIKAIKSPPKSSKPTTSPPPPPPPPPGFQLLKVQIMGDYKLGISRDEYDSLAKTLLFIDTKDHKYQLLQWPAFYLNRMTSLQFSTNADAFPSDFSEILKNYEDRLGAPVEKLERDSSFIFPSVLDTLLHGEYRVKITMLTWNFKYYDLVIHRSMIDMKNGTWKVNLRLNYTGNEKYLEMLRNIERR